MPARYVTVDRETPMLLPPDLRDWVPADHLVHFVIDAIGSVPLIAWLPAPAGEALRKLYHRQKSSFVIDPDVRRMVIDCYRDEIRRTEDLIGTDLSAWLR
jgi:hypothetical protein